MSLPYSILVVDDEESACSALAELLRMDGYRVDVAFNGKGALERFRQSTPDLLLCDVNMPGLDGFGVMRKVHKISPRCPVILMSVHAGSRLTGQGALDEAAAFLLKPLDFDELTRTIARTIAARTTLS